MRLIDADKLCEDLLERWSVADTRKEELIRQVMADIVTPIIAGQPTIEPMRKKGRWLEGGVFDDPQGKIIEQWQSARCSVCGKYHTTPYLYYFDWYNFCPNCGAKMEVEHAHNN